MAGLELNELGSAGALTGTELVYLEQGGDSVRSTAAAIAALGGAGVLAGTWTHSGDVPNVDFDISGYSTVIVSLEAVTLSVSGLRTLIVSTDGGSSFYDTTGDYVTLSEAGTVSGTTTVACHGTDATGARSGVIRLNAVGVVGAHKLIERTSRPSTGPALFVASTDAITDIRILGTNGGNLTGGTINVFAR
jgi:hypothetical protein